MTKLQKVFLIELQKALMTKLYSQSLIHRAQFKKLFVKRITLFEKKRTNLISHKTGGGLYVRINNNWYLQGITSNTKLSNNPINPTCNYESYAVFTNVTYYTGNLIHFTVDASLMN